MSVFDSTTVAAWLADALAKPGVGPRLEYILEELEDLLVDGPLADGDIDHVTDPTIITPDADFVGITTTGNVTATLADAARAGHLLTIKVDALGGVHTVAITPANFADGATITFNTALEAAILMFDGTDWQVISNNGGVLS